MPEISTSFLGKPYTRGPGTLQIGDKVRVHPSTDNHAAAYDATIIEYRGHICLDVPEGKFKAQITSSLFNRMEKI